MRARVAASAPAAPYPGRAEHEGKAPLRVAGGRKIPTACAVPPDLLRNARMAVSGKLHRSVLQRANGRRGPIASMVAELRGCRRHSTTNVKSGLLWRFGFGDADILDLRRGRAFMHRRDQRIDRLAGTRYYRLDFSVTMRTPRADGCSWRWQWLGADARSIRARFPFTSRVWPPSGRSSTTISSTRSAAISRMRIHLAFGQAPK